MALAEVAERLKELTELDPEACFERYRQQTGSDEVSGFINYLLAEDLIDVSLFTELLMTGQVDLRRCGEAADDVDGAAEELDPLAQLATQLGQSLGAEAEHEAEPEQEAEPATGTGTEQRYDLLGMIGKGAMGEVHIARDIYLRRKVAFKNIAAEMTARQEVFTRFLSEMQITSQLDHPNIVPVYGLEVSADGAIAYAMKLVRGKELAQLIAQAREAITKSEPLDEQHRVSYRLECFLKVCDAVSFAHEKGVIHRDLKPANIMIGRHHEVYVMDWGIARAMGEAGQAGDLGIDLSSAEDDDVTRTRMGTALGTPIYMSPEQAQGRNDELDGRSDLYTLGLILQEIVTLQRAMQGSSLAEVVANAKAGKRAAPTPLAPGRPVARELRAIVDKATRLTPEDRYQTVQDLAADVRRYLRNEEVSAAPDSPLQKTGRWVSNHRGAALAIMVSFLFIAVCAMATSFFYRHEAEVEKRQLRLNDFVGRVVLHASRIDHELCRYEAELGRVVGAAEEVITHAEASRLDVHFEPHFSGKHPPPSDLVFSPYYDKKVSSSWPVFLLAPGKTANAVDSELRKLGWLRPIFRSVMLESHHDAPHTLSAQEQNQIITKAGTPVHRVFVSLTNGVHVAFPGMAGFPAGYDPSKRPYYARAANRVGMHWGTPYPDVHGHGLVMSCSSALFDDKNEFRGVAGLEVTLNYLIEHLLDIEELDFVEEAMLVDGDGMVVAHKVHEGMAEKVKHLHHNEPIDLRPLPVAEVVDAIKRDESGYQEILQDGDELVVAYTPLASTDWFYVVIADRTKMFGQPSPHRRGLPTGKTLRAERAAQKR